MKPSTFGKNTEYNPKYMNGEKEVSFLSFHFIEQPSPGIFSIDGSKETVPGRRLEPPVSSFNYSQDGAAGSQEPVVTQRMLLQ